MVRSQRAGPTKEECVQCRQRSHGFIVKDEARQMKSGRQPKEDDLPPNLGFADVLELLRGYCVGRADFERDVSMDRGVTRGEGESARVRPHMLAHHGGGMDSGIPFRPFSLYPCGEAPGPDRYLTRVVTGTSRGHTNRGFQQTKALGPCRECPQATGHRGAAMPGSRECPQAKAPSHGGHERTPIQDFTIWISRSGFLNTQISSRKSRFCLDGGLRTYVTHHTRVHAKRP